MNELIYFGCENLFSFKDKIEFTTETSKGKSSLVSVIYGANASGKTNFIKALDFFKFLILSSKDRNAQEMIPVFPFKKTLDRDTEFKIMFKSNNVKYAYYLKLNKERIIEENLYHYPSGKISKIYTRLYNSESKSYEFDYARNYIKELKNLEIVCPSNKIFLSVAALWKEIDEIKNPFRFFSEVLQTNIGIRDVKWIERSAEILESNSKEKEKFIELLKVILPGLKMINSEVERKKVSIDELPSDLPMEFKILMSQGESTKIDIKLEYENGVVVDLSEESKGIKRCVEILGPILDILKNGNILLFDELESSFHPVVAENIVKLFLDENQNCNKAQLIFTTHDVNLLDTESIGRDSIWFTERVAENDYSTELYPLSSIEDVKKSENLRKNYLKGKYSWIPVMDNFKVEKLFCDSGSDK
ncbi:MAG: AAA family ATPase [Cetobacterium sp.]|uniref:AAA family ATPase n=1 Tax=Cetobacterium sp. TaxID=2071632 RepID=UPI003EE6D06D